MSKIKKLLVSVSVAVFALTIVASSANAQSTFTWAGPLSQGSTGTGVMNLQKFLNLCADTQVSVYGAGSPGMETSTFGPATKAAVIKFQMKNGVMPAAGYFGPLSQAKAAQLLASGNVCGGMTTPNLPAGCTTTAGFSAINGAPCSGGSNLPAGCLPGYMYSTTTGQPCTGGSTPTPNPSGPLSGTDGSISDVTTLSQYSDEEVGEGESDVKVAGFDLETSNDGDIALKSMKLRFDPTSNGSGDSNNLDDYIDSVSIWMGSTKIGSADVDDFSENSDDTFSRTVTLSNAVVRSDKTEKFYITVDAAGSFDSSDIDTDDWSVGVENIRYEDGAGVVTTDTTSFTSTAGEIGWNSTDDGIEINFVSFSTASDTELKLSTASDSPEAGIVVASNSGTTDDVVLLKGKLKLEGDSDVLLDELPVTFAPTTSNFNTIVSSIKLKINGEEFSESVPSIAAAATASIPFDNLDLTIEAGETIEFEVLAEIADTDDFTAGSTITASVTSTNRSAMDVENEEGDQLTAAEKSGTVGGEALEFRANGIAVSLVSTDAVKSASDTNNGDTATFTIKFKITAVGDDMYVATTASTAGAMNNLYSVDLSGTATLTDVSAVLVNNTDTTVTSGLYLIEEGESETFTLTVLRNGSDDDGLYRAALTSIKWDDEAGDTTPDNNYTTNLDDFKTNYVSLD